ncbi:MAG TPA: SDR family NAD(P)-dependent oxidoreductase [Amaricoccus sp.]|uniref:SDR family NAD(P)-dependent oxidoreductase n=1 Tax=Amaricoccus sp. TaxID=1872485 RepID=UPI001DF6CAEF|nr:SDR family NAD(P)-dependent oxidoreductase [Amaricoccus sp.]MCB1373556.1 SDR family NAD(P)-dependent oxidoreductase [Paracoccaceae bacterium]MCB1402043.1 SDR family NAD(P)-dependent oxidoreductase [Paracoccaceae bacterium]HPG21425.1 SDR family NAD(P)-dependent oxidoreductase [Amaricoccus sp.]HRW16239.1 SDR family NAD(P)-dependent oxidoreductase [Amaricoccus sp.]
MGEPVLVTLGHGYSAARLAASLPPPWRVAGTTRSAERAEAMRAAGVDAIDWADAAAVGAAIRGASHVLVSLPAEAWGDPVLARHRGDLEAARDLAWLGYLSTTGVYGDRQGGWVDETSALVPVNARSRWRVSAETEWASTGLPLHRFRLAGIYGPGRSALDRLRGGRAQRIVKAGQVFSRIHVADIAAALAASMARPAPGAVFNLADDEPAPPQDVIAFAAELLGLPVPPEIPFDEAALSPMARSFFGESKRVSNRRVKAELGLALAYPDYRAGLRAILAAGG